jgi:L,D-transpeptidase YcbB
MRLVYRIALALVVSAPLGTASFAAEPDAPETLITRSEAIRLGIQNRLSAKFKEISDTRKAEHGALVEYYAAPEIGPLWVDENGLNERGKAVIAEIEKAGDYGLNASDYDLPTASELSKAETGFNPDHLAGIELKVSFAALDYAYHARGGRIVPSRISSLFDPNMALPNAFEVIGSIAIRSDPAAYLRSFHPRHPQFEKLRQVLLEMRGGESAKPSEHPGIADGPALRLGVEHEQVALLRARFDVPAENGENELVFDAKLEDAVKEFQKSRGSVADGIVGPGTRRLLNGKPEVAAAPSRERIILSNMERWRWLPNDLGSFYVHANVPEFMTYIVEDGDVIQAERMVVGKTRTPTPIFSNEIRTIVFNPYWYMPNSIKVEEIRPYLREETGGWFFSARTGGWDTSVLDRHNLRVNYKGKQVDPRTLDWNRIDIRTLNIYQPPGPDNVLGIMKILFPNKHAVYMHDTPQRHLFNKDVRAESHGCLRLQNPERIVLTLLQKDGNWNEARVANAIKDSYDKQIAIRNPIPVHITYFTAWVSDNGSVRYFNDLYGHDNRIASALRF